MKLRFYARAEHRVREAGVTRQVGAASRYYGRAHDPAKPLEYPVSREPFEVEAGTEDGDKCTKHCRKGALLAADAKTAEAIGVAFVDTEFKDGDHVPKAKSKAVA